MPRLPGRSKSPHNSSLPVHTFTYTTSKQQRFSQSTLKHRKITHIWLLQMWPNFRVHPKLDPKDTESPRNARRPRDPVFGQSRTRTLQHLPPTSHHPHNFPTLCNNISTFILTKLNFHQVLAHHIVHHMPPPKTPTTQPMHSKASPNYSQTITKHLCKI